MKAEPTLGWQHILQLDRNGSSFVCSLLHLRACPEPAPQVRPTEATRGVAWDLSIYFCYLGSLAQRWPLCRAIFILSCSLLQLIGLSRAVSTKRRTQGAREDVKLHVGACWKASPDIHQTLQDPNQCACLAGIEMEIVNSCEASNGGCSHACHHTSSGPVCTCNFGYQLEEDQKTCTGKAREMSRFVFTDMSQVMRIPTD